MGLRAVTLTACALACFAANSLLCRMALAQGHIDATNFTAIRLTSGAVVLALLAHGRPRGDGASDAGGGARDGTRERGAARWLSACALFAYAAPFSYAYVRVGAALGALVLFGCVQLTMLTWGVVRGERPSAVGWAGIVVALVGLVILTVPGKSAPDPLGTVGMVCAGVAWAVYSLRGRIVKSDPVVTTSRSFSRATLLGLVLAVVVPLTGAHTAHVTSRGALLAMASGGLASGVGYSVWYGALRHLTATRAAVVQLLVPIVAASGGVVLLGEAVSTRLVVASVAILAGVGVTIAARQ